MTTHQVFETHNIKTNNRRYYVDGKRVSQETLNILKRGCVKDSIVVQVTLTHFRHFYTIS